MTKSHASELALLILFGLSFGVGWLLLDGASFWGLLGWALGLMIVPAIAYLLTRRAVPGKRIFIMVLLWAAMVGVVLAQQWFERMTSAG